MARIRSIKPEFFRHEALQDLEESNPGKHCMLVFAGLWTISDKNGVFECKPRHIKLDILPFMSFDMEETLSALIGAGFFQVFEADGKRYGFIPSFRNHQRISGQENQSDAKFPGPDQGMILEAAETKQRSTKEATGKQRGSTTDYPGSNNENADHSSKEAPKKQQGSIKEESDSFPVALGKGKGKVKGKDSDVSDIPLSLNSPSFISAWNDWRKYRAEIKHKLTPSTEAALLGKFESWGPDRATAAIRFTIEMGWQGIREPRSADLAAEEPGKLELSL